MTTRRSLLTGIGAFLCAPALVRAGSLMPVKVWDDGLVKCMERFLQGSHGTVAFCPAAISPNPINNWSLVGAAEQIWKGDLIRVRDGYAYRLCPADLKFGGLEKFGVALTNSEHSTHLF